MPLNYRHLYCILSLSLYGLLFLCMYHFLIIAN